MSWLRQLWGREGRQGTLGTVPASFCWARDAGEPGWREAAVSGRGWRSSGGNSVSHPGSWRFNWCPPFSIARLQREPLNTRW